MVCSVFFVLAVTPHGLNSTSRLVFASLSPFCVLTFCRMLVAFVLWVLWSSSESGGFGGVPPCFSCFWCHARVLNSASRGVLMSNLRPLCVLATCCPRWCYRYRPPVCRGCFVCCCVIVLHVGRRGGVSPCLGDFYHSTRLPSVSRRALMGGFVLLPLRVLPRRLLSLSSRLL